METTLQQRNRKQLTKNRTQLNQHAQTRQRARLTKISMANNSLADSFGLILLSAALTQKIQRLERAVVLKRHVRATRVLVRGAKIVKQAGDVVCLEHARQVWEVRLYDCVSWPLSALGEVCSI